MSDTKTSRSSDTDEVETEERRCDRHGPYVAERGGAGFFRFWSGCPTCDEEKSAERMRREAEEAAENRVANLEYRGILGRLQRMTLDNYDATTPEQQRALDGCRAFAADPEGALILVGTVGTGKTHLSVGICQAVEDGHYQRVMRLLRDIRSSYGGGKGPSEQDRIDHWATVPLLAIDEVGVQYATDAERLLLYEVIDERYIRELPTVLVSNQTTKEMGELLGPRVMDRLAEKGRVISFTWSSHRRAPQTEGRP